MDKLEKENSNKSLNRDKKTINEKIDKGTFKGEEALSADEHDIFREVILDEHITALKKINMEPTDKTVESILDYSAKTKGNKSKLKEHTLNHQYYNNQ